jgi:threonine dehydrogenase-like Zn-dependent dehydrogenase
MAEVMLGAILPGNSTVELREFPVPTPGHGQVLVKMQASTICGSDIRAIYREHLGKGPEGYTPGMICGHEPAGKIVATGPGMRRFKEGDRVILYHISGCGRCHDCRTGYQISCSSPLRAAYGWQRNGGNAEFCLAEEADCILMPDSMSYIDGACVACGFGTCYEAIRRIGISGDDIALVVGLGPMGLASLMLAKARGATKVIGVDVVPERLALTEKLGLADLVIKSDENALGRIREATAGRGCEAVIDCSGNTHGRQLAVRAARQWGRIAFVGEGGTVELNPSPDMIHDQKTIYGSWVTNLGNVEDLVERMPRWNMHPDKTCTHQFPLQKAGEAYRTMDEGKSGKVAIVFPE